MVVNYAKLQQQIAQNAQQNCQRFIISILIQTHVYKIHVRPNMQRLKTIHVWNAIMENMEMARAEQLYNVSLIFVPMGVVNVSTHS